MAQQVNIGELLRSINQVCREKGGKYSQYSAKTVSWDDAHRGTVGGDLSCWGANITDTRLWAKDGRRLFTVRPNNWNEKLGTAFSTDDLCLIVGNEKPGCDVRSPILLSDFLKRAGSEFGQYCGLTPENCPTLHLDTLDVQVSVRYQTTFIPASELWGTSPKRKHSVAFAQSPAALEFVTEAYNYNTMSDSDPKNLVLLCTSQGFSLQQDGEGAKKLFHHSIDRKCRITRHWLEAEQAENHSVGGEQKETEQEKREAAQRGKAASSVIGPKCLGTRFNALMTVQIPLEMEADRKTSTTPSNQDKSPCNLQTNTGMPEFKLILVGDGGVGKTTFVKRNLNGEFQHKYIPTQGAEVNSLIFYTTRGPIKFTVWDIAGQEKLRGLQDCYYVQGQCAIVMFDVNRKDTFKHTTQWIDELTRVCGDIPIILCGNNKLGTIESHYKVKETYISTQSKRKLSKIMISVRLGHNLDLPFLYLTRTLSDDHGLTFVEAPALCPPESSIDEETLALYKAELEMAASIPLPDSDYDDDDIVELVSQLHRPPIGRSNAARLSIGSAYDTTWKGLEVVSSTHIKDQNRTTKLKRHKNQHITVTIILYYTVVDGVPSSDDVLRAIDDLESLYEASSPSTLASNNSDFMKDELTVKNANDIKEKLTNQPYFAYGAPVSNADVFPDKL